MIKVSNNKVRKSMYAVFETINIFINNKNLYPY